jgi:hypothetical protein
VSLLGSVENIDPLFDFDENDLNSVLFGGNWGNIPSLSPSNLSLDNATVGGSSKPFNVDWGDIPSLSPGNLALNNVAVVGSSEPFRGEDVTSPREIPSEPL